VFYIEKAYSGADYGMSFADMLLLSFPRGGSSIGRDESEAGNCGGLWSWRL